MSRVRVVTMTPGAEDRHQDGGVSIDYYTKLAKETTNPWPGAFS